MLEDAVRRWTAAYIAHAKKKHAEGWLQCSGCLSLHEGIVHFFCLHAALPENVCLGPAIVWLALTLEQSNKTLIAIFSQQ